MKESARAALSCVRSHTDELGVADDWFENHDLHIHVPAGAVPKDGPSAGVTIATAIASLIRNERVADDVAMTGEITLTGLVLPIGGIREKSLAAQRAGLKRIILPRENEKRPRRAPAGDPQRPRVHPGRHDRGRVRGCVSRARDRPAHGGG